ncbi:hypothetical protein [Granulicella tundricola]|uniref:Uncharacterized protein n=1 Tax=Granulicella tundricola (strain ATCC BAA-1859 / DSM 23138 / MP5ACTX9) TaxID=1198114 RepID=E8WW03_GRATM|nr:hypothetical protein [Granulicella tundricola]ADW67309.1 hypothetical protein AciX9_0235 [Granulicella tundricola MP5ACTX9]
MKILLRKLRWIDLGLAVLLATISVPFIFRSVMNHRMELYVRIYPHDGQDSLGAFFDALTASAFSWIGIIILLLGLRWLYVTLRPENLPLQTDISSK